ncbi:MULTISPECIES: LPXTG cell wall anchor domain-containing protein [unclassified Microbacterium]|uniref:LPXTG cell wall anchor domain-containing protein n=1 Tax=unclassified Microbacterium TaxID=2609290 RepID=UPI0030173D66
MSAFVDVSGDSYFLKQPSRLARGARILGAIALMLGILISLVFYMAPASATVFGTRGSVEDARSKANGADLYASDNAGVASVTATDAELISGQWDGRTVHLDWRGSEYATAEASFVGQRLVSPGDHVSRTLRVRNDGPSDGVMTVGLVLAETVPMLTANPQLGDHVTLFWDIAGVTGSAPFSGLLALDDGRPELVEVQVPRGGDVPVTVGFDVPASLTTEMRANTASTDLRFDIQVHLEGDTSATPPKLAQTGADAARTLALIAVALGLAAAGLLLFAARRRRCDRCDDAIGRGAPWVARRQASGERETLCVACAPEPLGAALMLPV